jgi:hypothetical protein
MSGNWNEYNLNILTRIHWRASLVKKLLTPERVTVLTVASLTRGKVIKLLETIDTGSTTHVNMLSSDTISSQICLNQMQSID